MKKNRPKSTNIIDRRSPFGSESVDMTYTVDNRIREFLRDSLANPNPVLPQKFKKSPLTIEQILVDSVNAR